jgi:hypothetical protein
LLVVVSAGLVSLDSFMTLDGASQAPMARSRGGPIARLAVAGSICTVAFAALAGCSFDQGIGPYLVDPGRYSAYHCRDFAGELTTLITHEKELRDLMARASDGGGGAVIGQLSYRTEYEKTVANENVLRRTAAGKKCDLPAPQTQPATFQSDQTIR